MPRGKPMARVGAPCRGHGRACGGGRAPYGSSAPAPPSTWTSRRVRRPTAVAAFSVTCN